MKAFAEDQDAAKLMGIKESTVSIWTWVLSALVGGVTGIVFAPVLFLQQDYMNIIFIKGFVAAILGGFLSLSGGVAGGLFLENLRHLLSNGRRESSQPLYQLYSCLSFY